MRYDDLVVVGRSYSRAVGLSLSTIGNRALNNGRFFQRLVEGDGCTVRTYNRVLRWFSDHWPPELEWPGDIPRPAPSADGKEAA